MVGNRLATHQKKALQQKAWIVLIDESGLLMAPLVRRTWALRGQTPQLYQRGKHREKVSLAAALCLSPKRDQLSLIWHTLVNAYFNNERIARFLENLMREIPHRLIVVWDRGNMHKGDPIRAQVERFRPRLSLELLPPYAPMLNPVEQVFTWIKHGRLSNYAPPNAHMLNRTLRGELQTLEQDQRAIRKIWHASQLPLPRRLG